MLGELQVLVRQAQELYDRMECTRVTHSATGGSDGVKLYSPLEKQSWWTPKKVLLIIVGILLCGVFLESQVQQDTDRTTTRTTAQSDSGGSIGKTVEAWVAAMGFVKRQLVAPSTAKFIGVARSPYVQYLGEDRYLIRAAVDAQNSFGAMIRTEFRLVVRDERDNRKTWTLEEINI